MYIGTIGSKISTVVTLKYRFENTNFYNGWNATTTYTYIMVDAENNTFVWKTTSCLDYPINEDELGFLNIGDSFEITGTIKAHTTYKENEQNVLTRCKYKLVSKAPDYKAIKREKQMATLNEGDIIMEMPYRNYKEHYADCETVCDSFNYDLGTIKVIVRAGRLVPSGVRGQHYSGYQLTDENGRTACYRAVCVENALKRAEKEFPGRVWSLSRVFAY